MNNGLYPSSRPRLFARAGGDKSAVVIPAEATPEIYTHGLGKRPEWVEVVARNISTEGGWNPGDEVSINAIVYNNGTYQLPAVVWMANDQRIEVVLTADGGSGPRILQRTNNTSAALTRNKWQFKVYARAE